MVTAVHKENPVSDEAVNYLHLTGADMVIEVRDAFLRTSAGYLDVAEPMPGQGLSRFRYDRTLRIDELR
jgi:hypothetical protein